MTILPNIVLLVVDCLRADHLSCYGYPKPTPNIDTVASLGTQYMNAWAAGSFTAESVPFILSEYLYLQLKRRGYFGSTVLHTNQYVTRYLVENKLDYHNIDMHPDSQKHKYVSKMLNFLSILTTRTYHGEASAEDINEMALSIISQLPRPFFLCLWYMDVHPPHFPPGETRLSDIRLNTRYKKTALRKDPGYLLVGDIDKLIENYDKEIKYFDDNLFNLLVKLPGETAVILTSDHGEEFMEKGGLGHHGAEIPELRHVPLIVKKPRSIPSIVHEPFDFRQFDKFVLNIID